MLFQMPGDDVTCGGVKIHGVKILFQKRKYRIDCVYFSSSTSIRDFLSLKIFCECLPYFFVCVLFLSAGGVEGLRVYTKLFLLPLTAINTFRCDPL